MLQEASLTGLFKILIGILLFYYLVKVLSRIFAPFLMKYAEKKVQQRFGEQFGGFQNQQHGQKQKNEGEISIDKMPQKKSSNNNVGEYVDYEEID